MSLKSRARYGDKVALQRIFEQFLPPDEQIEFATFLGLKGIFGIGSHSFAAVTSRRVASLELSILGGAIYRDGYHEHVNGTVTHQPSRAYEIGCVVGCFIAWAYSLYLIASLGLPAAVLAIGIVFWLALAAALTPIITRLFYRLVKSGLVLVVREGVNVYCFSDRSRLGQASEMASLATELRDRRLSALRSGRTLNGSGTVGRGTTATEGGIAPRLRPGDRVGRPRDGSSAFTAPAVLSVIAFGLLAACGVLGIGLTQEYSQGDYSIWAYGVPWEWLLPTAVVAVSVLVALAGGRSVVRTLGVTAAISSSFVIGLQTLLILGLMIKSGIADAAEGFWLVVCGGFTVVLGGATLAVGACRSGLMTLDRQITERPMQDPVTMLAMIGGAVATVGAVMPWYGYDGSFWGLLPDYNSLFAPFFVCSVGLCIVVSGGVLVVRQHMARGGLLAGWSVAVIGLMTGIELFYDDLLAGARVFEAGVGIMAVAAVLTLRRSRDTSVIDVRDSDSTSVSSDESSPVLR